MTWERPESDMAYDRLPKKKAHGTYKRVVWYLQKGRKVPFEVKTTSRNDKTTSMDDKTTSRDDKTTSRIELSWIIGTRDPLSMLY